MVTSSILHVPTGHYANGQAPARHCRHPSARQRPKDKRNGAYRALQGGLCVPMRTQSPVSPSFLAALLLHAETRTKAGSGRQRKVTMPRLRARVCLASRPQPAFVSSDTWHARVPCTCPSTQVHGPDDHHFVSCLLPTLCCRRVTRCSLRGLRVIASSMNPFSSACEESCLAACTTPSPSLCDVEVSPPRTPLEHTRCQSPRAWTVYTLQDHRCGSLHSKHTPCLSFLGIHSYLPYLAYLGSSTYPGTRVGYRH